MHWINSASGRAGSALLVGLALFMGQPAHAAISAAGLRSLLEAKQAQAAFDAAMASDESLGEPEFDFYFGIAALEVNRPTEAVLALERYMLRFPDNASARFHLGRAYFAAGEDDAAQREFVALQATQKGDIREGATRFLALIEARQPKPSSNWGLFVETGAGYDNNVTTGIDSGTQPVVPGFGTLPVQPDLSTGVAAADNFVSFSVGLHGGVALNEALRLVVGLNADIRELARSENAMYNQRGLRAETGLQWESNATRLRALLGYSQAWLDGARYSATPSLVAEMTHQLNQRQQLALNLQWTRPRYDDGCSYFVRDRSTPCVPNQASGRDADVAGLGVGWSYQAGGAWAPLLSLGMSTARERNVRDNESLSRRIDGARAGMSFGVSERLDLGLGVSWLHSLYAEKYPVADVARDDRQITLDASATYRLNPNWFLRTEALSSQQESNIGLYAYRRQVLSVAVRRVFN